MSGIYLILCLIGFALPYSQFVPWALTHGLNVPLLLRELFANSISAFFGLDVILATVVLWIFIVTESARLRVSHAWAPLLASLAVGISFALPLFLYLRQKRLDETFQGLR